ncbi:MAG TPA: hypothetical protein PLG47_05190 [Candidatus Dojkabacteria bacterium]|nr:hypothetical protein [Candidatus Dojkabacteria bacterium]
MSGEAPKTYKQKYMEFLTLYKVYTGSQIKQKLKISKTQYNNMLVKAIQAALVEKEAKILAENKHSFSDNEDDYGYNYKDVKSTFKTFIDMKKKTKLQHAIRKYKQTFNI